MLIGNARTKPAMTIHWYPACAMASSTSEAAAAPSRLFHAAQAPAHRGLYRSIEDVALTDEALGERR